MKVQNREIIIIVSVVILITCLLFQFKRTEKIEGVEIDKIIKKIEDKDLSKDPFLVSCMLYGKIDKETQDSLIDLSMVNDKKVIVEILKSL